MSGRLAFVAHDLDEQGSNPELAKNTWNLLRALRETGDWQLHFLSTHPKPKALVKDRLRDLGYSLTVMDGLPIAKDSISFSIDPHLDRSEALCERLQRENFDVILFQDHLGEGFYSIRAKRMGLAFPKTTLITALVGPTSWLLANEREWSSNPLRDVRLSFLERYCCENSDAVISLSEEIRDWCGRQMWPLAPLISRVSEVVRTPKAAPSKEKYDARVSICMAHYNHGRFLPEALKALSENDYPFFDVIVVDDASNDEASKMVFERLKSQYSARGWKFILKEVNEGPQMTRNLAASHSEAEYLIFVDADNLPHPTMISELVSGIQVAGIDSLSCWFNYLGATGGSKIAKPLGAALEFGWLTNVFGDTNFCIKRATFSALGGFRSGDVKGVEDWELLARLASAGFQHDVYPKVLYDYRELADSLSRSTDMDRKHRAILESLTEGCPPHIRRLFFEYLVPSHLQLSAREHRVAQLFRHIVER